MKFDADDPDLIDDARTVTLADVGAPGYSAATAINPDGTTHLVLVSRLHLLRDSGTSYEPECPNATHEQLGRLPIEFARRFAISQRRRRPQGGPQ